VNPGSHAPWAAPSPAPLSPFPTSTGAEEAPASTAPTVTPEQPAPSPSTSTEVVSHLRVDEPLPVEVSGGSGVIDALTAIGTLAAVIVALGFGVWETIRAKWAAEVADDRQVLAQVASVVALGQEISSVGQKLWTATVYNGSDRPVFDVVVQPPTGPAIEVGLVMPHLRREGPTQSRTAGGEVRVTSHLAVVFTDAGGRRWRRPGNSDAVTTARFDDPIAEHLFSAERLSRREQRARRLRTRLGYARPIWKVEELPSLDELPAD
jgi:hypothetical protein